MLHQQSDSKDTSTGVKLPPLPGSVTVAARGVRADLPGSSAALDSPLLATSAQATTTHLKAVDVIVMDHEMPVMNGSAATSRLRQLGVTCAIIGASGNAFDRDQQAFRASGLNELFSKPVDAHALLGFIRTYLAERSSIALSASDAAGGDSDTGVRAGKASPPTSGISPVTDCYRP
jgi:CheY-like chemotaxis protein